MDKLIFGSTAIKHWFFDYDKTPKDLDYICHCLPIDYTKQSGVEYHIPTNGAFDILAFYNQDRKYVDPDLIYTIKVSHLAWEGKNGKWTKHLKDVVFLQNKGCKLNKVVFDIFYQEWENRFGNKSNISLNKATEMFFKDGVRRDYDHDWLHEYFKIGDVPAYTRAQTNPSSPMMSREIFYSLSKQHQLNCALEEMFVVSFERGVSLFTAYKSLVTKMTKGWFNLFLIQNAEILLDCLTDEKESYRIRVDELRKEINND